MSTDLALDEVKGTVPSSWYLELKAEHDRLLAATRLAIETWCEDDCAEWGHGVGYDVMAALDTALKKAEGLEDA